MQLILIYYFLSRWSLESAPMREKPAPDPYILRYLKLPMIHSTLSNCFCFCFRFRCVSGTLCLIYKVYMQPYLCESSTSSTFSTFLTPGSSRLIPRPVSHPCPSTAARSPLTGIVTCSYCLFVIQCHGRSRSCRTAPSPGRGWWWSACGRSGTCYARWSCSWSTAQKGSPYRSAGCASAGPKRNSATRCVHQKTYIFDI